MENTFAGALLARSYKYNKNQSRLKTVACAAIRARLDKTIAIALLVKSYNKKQRRLSSPVPTAKIRA